ncbi:MAG: hypothetical protein ACTSPM_11600 [Candidatus Heimdallarchaeota archaeon]
MLKSIGNNLILGRSLENSLFKAIKDLPREIDEKEDWLKMINMGNNCKDVFQNIADKTSDISLSRVWILLTKISLISSSESGEKLIEIAENLEKNNIMTENRNSIFKAQRYKLLFLVSVTSIFLGIIAGLAPLFATFAAMFKEISIPQITLSLIPISLYVISETSVYFISDIGFGKFNLKSFILSSIAYICSFLLAKGIIFLIL